MQNFLTVTDVAKTLRVKAETVNLWITAGTLVAVDVGTRRHQYRVSQTDFDAFCDARRVQKKTATSSRRQRGRLARKEYV